MLVADRKISCCVAALLLSTGLLATGSFASDWRMIGPDGGNVRSLACDPSDPNHILLGTSASQLFASHDGGNSWELFAHFRLGEDYVVDHIVFDPANWATIYVAGWGLFDDTEGGVFHSDDGGRTWRELPGVHGKSIRAMAMAPSDHNALVVGALIWSDLSSTKSNHERFFRFVLFLLRQGSLERPGAVKGARGGRGEANP